MNKLIISTTFPVIVATLLKAHDLVDNLPPIAAIGATDLEVPYPDDALCQSLAFWFALAIGCGLVSDYRLITAHQIQQYQRFGEFLKEREQS